MMHNWRISWQDFYPKLMQSGCVLRIDRGDIRPLLQTVSVVRSKALRTAFHMVSSPQRDLECFADGSANPGISPPFVHRKYPFYHSAQYSFGNPTCFRSVVLTRNDSGVNDFWFPHRLQEPHQVLLGFLGSFLFYTGRTVTTALPSFAPPRHTSNC